MTAVVFDAYGTLFDVHSVTTLADQLFPGRGNDISQMWRQKQLEYSWLHALMNRYINFEIINQNSLTHTFNQLQLTYQLDQVNALLNGYQKLNAYPEAKNALQSLQSRQLAILSNGTHHMLKAVVEFNGLENLLDEILSVDDLQTYKPNPVVYQHAVNRLTTPKEEILFVSSNGWDVAGAKAFGFQVAWINRLGKAKDELGVSPDYMVPDLVALQKILE